MPTITQPSVNSGKDVRLSPTNIDFSALISRLKKSKLTEQIRKNNSISQLNKT